MESMRSTSRLLVFLVSTPLVLLVGVGGLLGTSAVARQQSFAHLRIFEDVLSLIRTSYVEPVDVDKVMDGAMRGLADGLDSSSAFLTPDEVRAVEAETPLPPAGVGLVVTRQFYLRVVGVRDGSPADHAGLQTGDFIQMIDTSPTRELSALEGARMLRGEPGTKVKLTILRGSAVEPHDVDLVRELPAGPPVTGKRLPGGEGYVRVVSFAAGTAQALRTEVESLEKAGAPGIVIDLRATADGTPEEAIAAARAFVKTGSLATLAGRGTDHTVTMATAGDGALTLPVELLVSNGTANAAEIFAAALAGNKRAELVGERTAGIAGVQHLVKLPDDYGLWMTYQEYLAADGTPIQGHGLQPAVAVAQPTVAFGQTPPATDQALTTALTRLRARQAA
jgi:carboxyl-terminal processing protease